MKIRPQKHVRQGFSGKSKLQRRSQPKTRKEIRKEKRQQKKINRFNYHSRKRSDRYPGKDGEEDPLEKQKRGGKGSGSDEEEEWDDDDEEIDSDLGEDVEDEPRVEVRKGKGAVKSQMELEREEELRELKSYEQGLREKRISQLEAANAEDDAIIKKYEKLLKINRRKNKEGVPKSFNDGLDYALELCTEDSIRKMYDAAREAAEMEQNSEDEFADDMGEVLGKKEGASVGKVEGKGKKKLGDKERKRMEKLKEVEKKYLGDDELDDGSLGGFDSELEIELASDYSENDELYDSEEDGPAVENKKDKKKQKKKAKSESEPEEDSEFDEDVFGLDSEDSEVEESIPKKKKKEASKGNKKSQPEPEEDDDDDELKKLFANKKKNNKSSNGKQKQNKKKASSSESEPEEDSEFDEDVFGLDSEDEVEEPAPNSKKKDKKKVTFEKEVSKKKKKKAQPESEPEEDSEFDEDVFGGDSEDDGLDNILDGIGSGDEEEKAEGKNKEKPGVWEDIYGRKRDRDGNVIKEDAAATGGKYIPPHMRARMEAQNGPGDAKRQEKLARLKRTLKGQINRLAETNVHRIAIELDNLYMQNARFDMNNLLTTLILDAVVSNTLAPERMVLEHVLLVTILHANVGSEVGSHFLETVVERFHALIGQIGAFDVEDKTLDNCVLILCHLYTFAIFKNKLIYDVIDQLLASFCEKGVECILLVLRSIGFVLRKDDPLALKDMILKVQKRAAEAPAELKNDTRVKYMLDTLLAVKNNNMNKIPQYDPTLVEHFRKILKGMITSGKYVSSLNIGLDDLLNVEERGKWWLVGSAWIGDAGAGKRGAAKNGTPQEEGFSQQLLELARKQRMNTDDKRNVFCAIMSAEDYLDAFDKILRLAIKDQRIVASVIVHCALAEKDHNPYYSILSQKFCEYDRRYQLAIQYTIWDRLKDIQSLKQAPIRNLAKLLTHLIGEGGLALSVLKVIEFAEIDKLTLRLVRQTMLGLLLLEEENKCLQVFNRIAPSFKLKSFKDSLRLFLHHFLLKGSDRSGVPEEQMQLLNQRIKMAERMLDTSEARVQF
ncbi:nucleolar MIF4G domain-containing protein 1 homolog isoform X2 [Culex quinquefasciatus]|uniref:nucleolar MIF4G domain-containing protein 1 homolog isoform X2 n=1 Tax=Culex quinquefasciatus TaxID=7176 RepID=UPI0018E30CD3|nr:nucleolar MIF4G domain-containing protein 1 homolog isoform X2 [Culex quinquefasciatus]